MRYKSVHYEKSNSYSPKPLQASGTHTTTGTQMSLSCCQHAPVRKPVFPHGDGYLAGLSVCEAVSGKH